MTNTEISFGITETERSSRHCFSMRTTKSSHRAAKVCVFALLTAVSVRAQNPESENMIRALSSPSVAERHHAIFQLRDIAKGGTETEPAVLAIASMIQDRDVGIQRDALDALRQIGPPALVARDKISAVLDGAPNVNLGPFAIEALVNCRAEPSTWYDRMLRYLEAARQPAIVVACAKAAEWVSVTYGLNAETVRTATDLLDAFDRTSDILVRATIAPIICGIGGYQPRVREMLIQLSSVNANGQEQDAAYKSLRVLGSGVPQEDRQLVVQRLRASPYSWIRDEVNRDYPDKGTDSSVL